MTAVILGGLLGAGALLGASVETANDPLHSPLAKADFATVQGQARGTATLVSLDVPWESEETVSVIAKAPEPEPEPAPQSQTGSSFLATASRGAAGVGPCGAGSSWTEQVRSMITSQFGITNIGGYRPGDPGDHGSGLALDVMVPISSALGDSVAAWAMANKGSLNISYVIWKQRINLGGGWTVMGDRGNLTANHYDHVHISLNPGWGSCG